jgi:hypothetical protein
MRDDGTVVALNRNTLFRFNPAVRLDPTEVAGGG